MKKALRILAIILAIGAMMQVVYVHAADKSPKGDTVRRGGGGEPGI